MLAVVVEGPDSRDFAATLAQSAVGRFADGLRVKRGTARLCRFPTSTHASRWIAFKTHVHVACHIRIGIAYTPEWLISSATGSSREVWLRAFTA